MRDSERRSAAALWIDPCPGNTVLLLLADLLDGVRAWVATLEALYLLADAEPHVPILPALTALMHLSVYVEAPVSALSAIPALLRATPLSLTALTLRLLPPLRRSPLSARRLRGSEGAAKATIPALPAPNLRALTLEVQGPVPQLPPRVDVGNGKRGVCARSSAAREAEWEAEVGWRRPRPWCKR
ncbi:hypothetical protein B0H11DRAFT_2231749 [Mycena galericulata]|nr:hypothetical protein B0H11DRAFT_2231749 [Mycena galericulata]